MIENLNLNWLRTFEAASRHLSFTAAGQELGLTQTAVSQHIKALELKLGQDLFVRRPKSLRLTEIGKAYLPSVRDSLESLKLATSGLFGPDMTTTVVVRASMAFILWLSPQLGRFQRLHPGVGIKLVTSIWPDVFDKQAVHFDVVLAPHGRANSQMEKLSDEFVVPVCGAVTSKGIGSVSDLTRLHPIHILGFDDHASRYLAQFGLSHDVRSTGLVVDTSVAACEMAAAELGCAFMIERFAQQAIRTGRPIKVVGDRVSLGQSHYLSRGEAARSIQPGTKAFANWLRSCFAP